MLEHNLIRFSILSLLTLLLFGLPVVTSHAQSPASEEVAWTYFDVPTDEIAMTPDGNLWATTLNQRLFSPTYSGMVYYDGETWTTVPHSELLVGACWTNASLVAAPDGTVWLGACGPNHFDGENWTVYISSRGGGRIFQDMEELTVVVSEQDAPPSNGVAALATASDGSLWLVPDGAGLGGVLRFDGETWTTYTVDDGLLSNTVYNVAIAPDDSIWVGTWEGLAHFDAETWTNYPQTRLLYYLSDFTVASDGTVWGLGTFVDANGFSMESNLFWFDGVELNALDSLEILDAYYVLTVAAAPDGTVWVGTDLGVSKFDGENWTNYRPEMADEEAGAFLGLGVLSIAFGPDGSVWCGTPGGIYHLTLSNN